MNAFKDTRVLAEAALAIALAFVLGLIKVFHMPFGGSISLEMVPLILLALRQGPASHAGALEFAERRTVS